MPGRLRIGFSTSPVAEAEVHGECTRAVLEAARRYEALGHDVEEASPRVDASRSTDIFPTIWLAMVAWAIRDWARRIGRTPTPADFEAYT